MPERGCLLETLINITVPLILCGLVLSILVHLAIIIRLMREERRGSADNVHIGAQTMHKPEAPSEAMRSKLMQPEDSIDVSTFVNIEATDFGKDE